MRNFLKVLLLSTVLVASVDAWAEIILVHPGLRVDLDGHYKDAVIYTDGTAEIGVDALTPPGGKATYVPTGGAHGYGYVRTASGETYSVSAVEWSPTNNNASSTSIKAFQNIMEEFFLCVI